MGMGMGGGEGDGCGCGEGGRWWLTGGSAKGGWREDGVWGIIRHEAVELFSPISHFPRTVLI